MKPMLASPADLKTLRYPVMASVKIDGIRCLTDKDGKAVTRTLMPIPNEHIRNQIEALQLPHLDGELELIDPDFPDRIGLTPFNITVSGVMRQTGTPKFRYILFDMVDAADTPYYERYEHMRNLARAADFLHGLHHEMVPSEEDLLALEALAIGAGHEGLITRDPRGAYKQGRSTKREQGMLKLKRFADSEGIIIGFEEQQHNTNEASKDALGKTKRSHAKAGLMGAGVLGALVLDTKWGELKVGTGFDAQQRADIWARRGSLLGKLATFKHAPAVKDKPRFPVFKSIRDESDAPSVAELMAERDAKNRPPDGISYKAWHAMRKGWVPAPGSPMYPVWRRYFAPPPPRVTWPYWATGLVTASLFALTTLAPKTESIIPQGCINDVPMAMQSNCTE